MKNGVLAGVLVAMMSALYACGGSDGGDFAAEGEPCMGGTDCAAGLLCLIKGKATMGTCTKNPSGCANPLKCGDKCLESVTMGCTGSSCLSIGGKATISCD